MKKAIVTITISVALLTAGILYGDHVNTDIQETLTLEEAYNAGFPVQLPDVIVQP